MGFFSDPLMIGLLMVTGIILLVSLLAYDRREREKNKKTQKNAEIEIKTQLENFEQRAVEAGLDPVVMYRSADISEEDIRRCAYPPPCGPGFVKLDGCCELERGEVLTKAQLYAKLAKDMLLIMGKTKLMEDAVEMFLKRSGEYLETQVRNRIVNEATEEATEEATRKVTARYRKELLEEGLEEGSERFEAALRKKLTKEGVKEIQEEVISKQSIEQVTKVSKELGEKFSIEISQEAAEKGTAFAAKRAVKGVIGKNIGRTASRIMLKSARVAGKILSKLGKMAGSSVFSLFQVGSAVLDIFDPEGYSQFTSQDMLRKMRKSQDYLLERAVRESGQAWPKLFPVNLAFESAFTEAIEKTSTFVSEETIQYVMKKKPDVGSMIAIKLIFGDDLTEVEEQTYDRAADEYIEKHARDRDEFMFETMSDILTPTMRRYIKYYPALTTKDRMAVSLSEAGVRWWNDRNRQAYLADDNALVPIYANQYYQLDRSDPGTLQKPNMELVTMRTGSAPLCGFYSAIFQQCEGVLDKGQTLGGLDKGKLEKFQPDINAYEYGVRFDDTNATCEFSKRFCDRMGLNYDARGDTDCKLPAGQKFVEDWLFGKTVTRGLKKFFS